MKNFEIKKNYKLLTALLAITIITAGCNIYKYEKLKDELEICKKKNDCNSNGFVGLISKETAQLLVDNYENSVAGNQYNKDKDHLDSRSVWFSYDELEKYMCAVKKEYQRDHPDLSKLGLRIYFGRYPKQSELTGDLREISVRNEEANQSRPSGEPRIEYGEKHCLFFVPTNHNDKGINEDMDLQIIVDKETFPAIWLLNKNHGGLAPPESIAGANLLIREQ